MLPMRRQSGMLPPLSSVGLFVARQAIEHGLSPTVFEASARVGGVWARHWTTLTTNSSVSMMSLVEPPMELPYRTFPKKGAIVDYVERYEKTPAPRHLISFQRAWVALPPL